MTTMMWRRFHRFDPYTAEAERRAQERAKETRSMREQGMSAAFVDPDVKRAREVHANQTKRAKSIPVTLPKVW